MNAKIIIAAVAAALGAVGVAQVVGFAKMRLTVHVIDEDGKPVPEAQGTFLFKEDLASLDKPHEYQVTTDNNGNFTLDAHSNDGVLGSTGQAIHKDGYYNSSVNAGPFETFENGHWLPWDQTYTTVLRKIGTPIPLYVRRLAVKIPAAVNEARGFDLVEADWVAPFGKGKVRDFIVTVTNAQYRSDNDYETNAAITFSNPDDGIQEVQLPPQFANSVFKWPRLAPENGYQSKLETQRLWLNIQRGHTQSINTAKEDQAYFFRVRTLKQGGKILSALYGKILGGISVGYGSANYGFIQFTYYLNPAPLDRNLEFSGNSLFTNLDSDEIFHAP